MIDAILGIDVSKNTLDVSISSCTKVRTKEGVFETVHHQDRSIFYNQVEATKVVPNSGVGDCGKIARHKQLPSAATLVFRAAASSATEGETGLIGFAAHAEGDALDALAYGIRAPSSEHPNTFTPFRRPTLECSDVRLGVAGNAQTHPRIAPPCNHAAAQARR